ncbi:hypothetical protein HK101_007688 [Irineochytrium annulatum]|nr:hypothetical protein HK101_007688 [Irineochytrium annulatum]
MSLLDTDVPNNTAGQNRQQQGGLPPGWIAQHDPNHNATFYVNTATGQSQWFHPRDPFAEPQPNVEPNANDQEAPPPGYTTFQEQVMAGGEAIASCYALELTMYVEQETADAAMARRLAIQDYEDSKRSQQQQQQGQQQPSNPSPNNTQNMMGNYPAPRRSGAQQQQQGLGAYGPGAPPPATRDLAGPPPAPYVAPPPQQYAAPPPAQYQQPQQPITVYQPAPPPAQVIVQQQPAPVIYAAPPVPPPPIIINGGPGYYGGYGGGFYGGGYYGPGYYNDGLAVGLAAGAVGALAFEAAFDPGTVSDSLPVLHPFKPVADHKHPPIPSIAMGKLQLTSPSKLTSKARNLFHRSRDSGLPQPDIDRPFWPSNSSSSDGFRLLDDTDDADDDTPVSAPAPARGGTASLPRRSSNAYASTSPSLNTRSPSNPSPSTAKPSLRPADLPATFSSPRMPVKPFEDMTVAEQQAHIEARIRQERADEAMARKLQARDDAAVNSAGRGFGPGLVQTGNARTVYATRTSLDRRGGQQQEVQRVYTEPNLLAFF